MDIFSRVLGLHFLFYGVMEVKQSQVYNFASVSTLGCSFVTDFYENNNDFKK